MHLLQIAELDRARSRALHRNPNPRDSLSGLHQRLTITTDRRTLLIVLRAFLMHFTERVQVGPYETDFSDLPGDVDFEAVIDSLAIEAIQEQEEMRDLGLVETEDEIVESVEKRMRDLLAAADWHEPGGSRN